MREIADSTLTVDEMKENLIQEYQTVTISDEEEENLELESHIQMTDDTKEDNLKDILKRRTNFFSWSEEVENEIKLN